MFTRNYGTGWLGRLITAILEVIVIAIVLVIISVVFEALSVAVPAVIILLAKLGLAVYFAGRVFGLIGPA